MKILFSVLLVALLLASCGQKGALVLPDNTQNDNENSEYE